MLLALVILVAAVSLIALGVALRRIAAATDGVAAEVDTLQAGLVPAVVRLESARTTTRARRDPHTR